MKLTHFISLTLMAALSALAQSAMAQAAVSRPAEWYLEANMMTLDASSRFVGGIVATNPTSSPVYVRSSVTRVMLKDGQRVRVPDEAGVIKVSPSEFVLRPKESFTVRLLADAKKLGAENASYYVKLEDVSAAQVQPGSLQGGLVNGLLLAYETLININTDALPALSEQQFAVTAAAGGKLALTNQSKQHIYLESGYACPDTKTLPVDCEAIKGFPKQSLLPGESVLFAATSQPYLAILAQPKLNARIRPSRVYLPMPR